MSRMSPDDWERARALVAAGLTPEQVASIMGTSAAAIRRRCVVAASDIETSAAPQAAPVITPQTPEEWSDALLAARTAAGVTQAEMSRMLGLGRGAYGHYESRGLLPRRMDVLDAIADRLGVDGRPLRRRLTYEQAVHAAAQQRRVAEMIAAGLPGPDGLTPREREQRRAESALRASGGYGRHDLDTIAKRRAVLLAVRAATARAG